jgi:hypothetical protein
MRHRKDGISKNGRMENVNKVKAIQCDCSKCGWHKLTRYGDIYCKWLRQNNPKREKCKRFYRLSELEDRKAIDSLKNVPRDNGKIMVKDTTSYEPALPWEIPVGESHKRKVRL